jgi:hypothetical protein
MSNRVMVTYQMLVLRLALRRVARLEQAPRNGLRLLPAPRRHLRLVSPGDARGGSDERSGSIHPLRAAHEPKRSRE